MQHCLFLLTSSACDIRCTYCFYETGHEPRTPGRIRPADAPQLARQAAATGFGTVILTGGDPLHSRLKHDTYALVSALKAEGLRAIINTSAALLDERDLDAIVCLGVDRVDVSIDSHRADLHDAQRGRHADAVRSIVGLLARGVSVVTTTVVTEATAPTLGDTLSWLRQLGVRDIRVQRAYLPGHVPAPDSPIEGALREAAALTPTPHGERYRALTAAAFANHPPSGEAVCQMGKLYAVCSPLGVLTPCFHRAELVLGNLLTDSVEDLRASLAHNALSAHQVPPCFGPHCASLFDNPRFWRDHP